VADRRLSADCGKHREHCHPARQTAAKGGSYANDTNRTPLTTMRPPVKELTVTDPEQQRREQAIKRIRNKKTFRLHLAVYLVINAAFVVVWAMSGSATSRQSSPWWGAGVAAHGYSVYGGNSQMTEAQIEREMKRLL
jgi:hypothetical protein